MFSIDSNVPLPAKKNAAKYPFPLMRIGDSFFVPLNPNSSTKCLAKLSSRLSVAGIHWASTNCHSHKFATRQVVENGVQGARVWRVS